MDYNKIKLVILDVDGTLTDGGIYYDSRGNEMKRFSAKDGLGIMVARRAGGVVQRWGASPRPTFCGFALPRRKFCILHFAFCILQSPLQYISRKNSA